MEPVSQLRSAPFNLNWGASVTVQVRAINAYGNSLYSLSGNGGILMTNPDSPIGITEVISLRTATTLGITWNNGPSNGGSTILDYSVFSDQGLSVWTML